MKTLTQYERSILRDELSIKLLDELAARMEDHMWKSTTERGENDYTENDKSNAVEHLVKQLFKI